MTCGWRCASGAPGRPGATLAYANLIGGQDELVFDGGSLLVAADGELLARGPQFEEALIVTDLDLPGRRGPDHRRGRAGGRRRRHGHHDPAHRARAGGGAAPGAGAERSPREPFWPSLPDRRGGLQRAGAGRPGLRAQERVPFGDPGPVRRHRLGPDRDDRRGRGRPGQRVHGAHAEPVLHRSFGGRCRGTGQAAGAALGDGADPVDGRRFRGRAGAGRIPSNRAARGEPAGQGTRRNPDGAVQRRTPSGADHGQQERAGDRLLDAVRGFGRRLRADQGRAEDAGVGAGPVAQRAGRRARRDAADPGELDHQAAERRTGPRPDGHRLAAGLPGARRPARRLRGEGHGLGAADRGRPRPRARAAGHPAGGPGRIQAPPVPAWSQDHAEELRPGPAAADHQRLAGEAGSGT